MPAQRCNNMSVESDDASLATAEELAATDPSKALSILARVLSRGLGRTQPELAARAFYLRARLLSETGRFDEALAAIRSAHNSWVAAGRPLEALRTDLGRATVLIEIGGFHDAINVSEALLDRLEGMTSEDDADLRKSIRAGAHGNLGNARNLIGEHTAAIGSYDLASNLYAALGNRAKQYEMDANRGIAYLHLGMVHRAVDELKRARSALAAQGLTRPAAKCLLDLAEAELLLGATRPAMMHLDEAEAELAPFNARAEIAKILLTRSRALFDTGQYDASHLQSCDAMDAFQELNMLSEVARAAQLAGGASLELGELDRAAKELAMAERLFVASNEEPRQAQVWLLMARLEAQRSQPQKAAKFAASAVNRLRGGNGVPAATAHLEISKYVSPEEAAQHLTTASELIDTFDLTSLHLPRDAAAAHHSRRTGDIEGAVITLAKALSNYQLHASETGEFAFNGRPKALAVEMTEDLISMLLEIDTPSSRAHAWQVSTVIKSAVLNEFVSGGARILSGTPYPGEATRELSNLYDDLRDMDQSGRDQFEEQLRVKEHEFVRRNLSTGIDWRGDAIATPPPVPDVSVLEFHVIGRDVIVFVLRDGGVEARTLCEAGVESKALVNEWRVECSRMRSGDGSSATRELVAAELMRAFYSLLVEPVEDLLEDLDGQPLVLACHRHLFAVPFEAIRGDGPTLSERFSLIFCPGFASFATSESQVFDESSVLVLAVPDAIAPSIADEARTIGRIWPKADVIVGDAATVSELRARMTGTALVHLACHGEFRGDNPLFSGIRLADGWLTAADVMWMDLRGTQVILSCCDVGRAADSHGEPMGLIWSMLAAGATSVIASKWTVDDEVATLFMTQLHTQLSDGAPTRVAMDRARRVVAERHPHPYYWAPFRFICSPLTAHTEGIPQ